MAILKNYDYSDGLTPEMTVDILQDLGPTFVKLGQIASTHTDMLPVEYCDALAQLRSSVAPVETLDMLQKSQLRLGGDFGVDPKTVKAAKPRAQRRARHARHGAVPGRVPGVLVGRGRGAAGARQHRLRLRCRGLRAHGVRVRDGAQGLVARRPHY
ncbi:MAG: hypothetical protein IKG22_13575 [Atopobiaceae bacterium]|nr:hypothetical protein [Atopobiaceae bacterium]